MKWEHASSHAPLDASSREHSFEKIAKTFDFVLIVERHQEQE